MCGTDGKESACNVGDRVQSLGWEDPLEKGMAIHSSIFAWRIPRTEEPSRLQSMESQRVSHHWATNFPWHRDPKNLVNLSPLLGRVADAEHGYHFCLVLLGLEGRGPCWLDPSTTTVESWSPQGWAARWRGHMLGEVPKTLTLIHDRTFSFYPKSLWILHWTWPVEIPDFFSIEV